MDVFDVKLGIRRVSGGCEVEYVRLKGDQVKSGNEDVR